MVSSASRFYQDSSLLPVAEEVSWSSAPFVKGAGTIGNHLGYEKWKCDEMARTLENIFRDALNAGKTFEEAMLEVEDTVQKAILVSNPANRP